MNKAEQKRILLDLAREYKPSEHDLKFNAAGQPLDNGPTEEDLEAEERLILKKEANLRCRYFEDLKSKLNPS